MSGDGAGNPEGADHPGGADPTGGARQPPVHRHPVRVYYEDTDLAGIVYHAGYLRFAERGRSEWLRALGIDQARLHAERGLAFAVAAMEARWIAPARFDDLLCVETVMRGATGARATLDQAVTRDGAALFEARVTVVATGPSGRPVRLPAELRSALAEAGAIPSPDARS